MSESRHSFAFGSSSELNDQSSPRMTDNLDAAMSRWFVSRSQPTDLAHAAWLGSHMRSFFVQHPLMSSLFRIGMGQESAKGRLRSRHNPDDRPLLRDIGTRGTTNVSNRVSGLLPAAFAALKKAWNKPRPCLRQPKWETANLKLLAQVNHKWKPLREIPSNPVLPAIYGSMLCNRLVFFRSTASLPSNPMSPAAAWLSPARRARDRNLGPIPSRHAPKLLWSCMH